MNPLLTPSTLDYPTRRLQDQAYRRQFMEEVRHTDALIREAFESLDNFKIPSGGRTRMVEHLSNLNARRETQVQAVQDESKGMFLRSPESGVCADVKETFMTGLEHEDPLPVEACSEDEYRQLLTRVLSMKRFLFEKDRPPT